MLISGREHGILPYVDKYLCLNTIGGRGRAIVAPAGRQSPAFGDGGERSAVDASRAEVIKAHMGYLSDVFPSLSEQMSGKET
jgi:hypothetical protein